MSRGVSEVGVHTVRVDPREERDEVEYLVRGVIGWTEERTLHFVALGRLMISVRRCSCRVAAPDALRQRIAAACRSEEGGGE